MTNVVEYLLIGLGVIVIYLIFNLVSLFLQWVRSKIF